MHAGYCVKHLKHLNYQNIYAILMPNWPNLIKYHLPTKDKHLEGLFHGRYSPKKKYTNATDQLNPASDSLPH
jgi:hypothetical protein